MSVFSVFDDEELVRAFGPVTFARGREYAEAGAVSHAEVTELQGRLMLLQGQVAGGSMVPYSTSVTLVDGETGPWLDGRCTCPVVRMCKHAVAVVLVVRGQHTGHEPGRLWERRLGQVLEELDQAAELRAESKRGLALQVELPLVRSTRRRAWSAATDSAAPAPRGGVRVRPLQRGARGSWVKTGAAWSDVPHLDRRGEHDPEQVAFLAEVGAAHRAANRQTYYGAEQHLTLASFGPSLWPLLARAQQLGIPLVAAGALSAVEVGVEPVEVALDVVRGDAGLDVRAGVRRGSEFYGSGDVELLGATGHGVALWRGDGVDRWAITLVPLARPAGPQTRRLLTSGEVLQVPTEESEELLLDYLPQVRRHLAVTSSDATVRVPESVPPRLALMVTWKAIDEVHIAWSWRYRSGDDDRVYGLDETRGLRGVRRPDEEAALLAALVLDDEQRHRLFAGRSPLQGPVPEQTFRGGLAVAFTEDTLVPLEASGQVEIEEVGPRPVFHEAAEAPVIRFAPRSGAAGDPAGDPVGGEDAAAGAAVDVRTDWLDLEVVVTVGSRSIGLATLLEALTMGQERLVLRDGAHVRLDRPEFAVLTELVREARELQEQPRDGVLVHRGDLGLWEELAEIGLIDAQAAAWVEAAKALRDLDGLPDVEPTGLRADLRSYQHEGFRWLTLLWQHRLGGILADDMGLGKTVQTLALIAHARAHGGGPFLVVAPTSVVSTWVAEAQAFTPGLTVRAVTESRSRRGTSLADVHAGADIVVTSYTLLRLEADAYAGLSWGGLILDEAQTVKNHTGKTYQSVRRLDVPFRLALSGTPMENRLMELWSLLSIVAPGLYPYPRRFAEAVANPVEKEGDAQALARFRARIKPFLLRRTKDLVAADLPPKQEQILEVTLTPKHRRVYDLHLQRERQNVLGLLGDFDRQRVAIFSSLTRLRQMSLDASLVDAEYAGIGSAKIDVLVDHVQEIVAEGHRALVFSQFTSFLGRVRDRLDREGIESQYLDGSTRHRGDVVNAFKRGEGSVFLISLKAGGVGLTLTEADYVFVLDPWWNPAVEAQAVDRAHRIGQQRPVIVYRLVAADTIEEKVMELKARKSALFGRVLDGDATASAALGAEDIRALFDD